MELLMGEGWNVEPAGGATGEAYIAHAGNHKVFLKRNSSPFLAVLSAEGIVPKLLWTKRLENGDVVTAQRWVPGRELKSYEMGRPDVAQLLSKIHSSSELLDMFKRIGNQPLTPGWIVEDLQDQLARAGVTHPLLHEAIRYLSAKRDEVIPPRMVVCHSDINHNNWMLSESDHLYLIDWDGATVADPALDLGLLLYGYIPRSEWNNWLTEYGTVLDAGLLKRMHWHVVSQTVSAIIWHFNRGEMTEAGSWTDDLKRLLNENLFFPPGE
ncbi:thiamine kinase-like enzyme [Salsuginibacillus halophilus]|uniref:Thiamine kinase-like enzyme n=1 Tax=Salsuginibacillus halophilus TaxID=517424 RepID=A0A2P8HE71_9BACI|nr:phosphotransferase family protein [Salsuginibacillus halophilus]PSL44528.1 thiamine kinase-like enzyme [Salsuginibacillus halophilus]